MEVNKVNINGFYKLKEAVDQYNNTGAAISKSDGTIKYLDRINVTMTISNLTTIQLFFLKNITNDIYVTSTNLNSRVHPEIKNTNHVNILKLYNTIINDNSIPEEVKSVAKNIIPIGSKKYDVIVRLTGKSLLILTGVMMDIFINIEMKDYLNDEESCCKQLGILFKDKFLDYINDECNNINTLFEFMKSEYDYNYADSLCTLATVETLNGCMNFINNDSNNLMKEIDIIKSSKIAIEKTDYNIYTFIINSSFSTFLDIYLYTNNMIINYEDLNIVYKNKVFRIDDEIMKKYHGRISELTKDHLEIKEHIATKKLPKDFCLFDYISYGTPIKYTIKIKESDVDLLFKNLDDNSETKNIHSSILNSINIVKKTLQ